jgi:hypothetical protein
MSLKFRYDPSQFNGREYKGGIQILKRTVLPRHMAASFGTAIAVSGGERMKMDERARQVLKEDIGLPDEEITALAEKQKELPEENVVEKASILDRLVEFLGKGQEKKAEKDAEEVEEVKEVQPEPTPEPEQAPAEKEDKGAEIALSEDVVKAVGIKVAEALAPIFSQEIEKATAPIQRELETLRAQVAEASKSVEEKVEERLEELPKVVVAKASAVEATKTEGSTPVQSKTADQKFLADIQKVVDQYAPKKVTV